MQDIRGEIREILKLLYLEAKNCNKELRKMPEGHLYSHNRNGKVVFFQATEKDGSYRNAKREVIARDGIIAKQLARKRFLQRLQRHLLQEIQQLEALLKTIDNYTYESLIQEMPRAYRLLPENYFTQVVCQPTTGDGWSTTKDGIIIPDRLIQNAKAGTLTDVDRKEIREIQREWAAQPYEINTKELKHKNIVTSTGLRVRSKSEGFIAEELNYYDIPFRHDQVIVIGQKRVSPDFTFFSIIDGEHYWEHGGLVNNPDYVSYHMYKQKIYASIGIVPWHNYIETFDEPDGSFDIRTIKAEIENKLLRRLQLQ